MNKSFTIKDLTLNAMIGAAYVALVFIFQKLSFELIQFRVAEVLLILVLFNPKLSYGLILGTIISNLFSPLGIIDIVVGTLASTITILLMILFKKNAWIASIFPALINGLIIGFLIHYMAALGEEISFFFAFGSVFIGEFVVMYLLGLPAYYYINKNENIKDLLCSISH